MKSRAPYLKMTAVLQNSEMLDHQIQDKYLPADSVFRDRCHFEVGVVGVVAEAVWVEVPTHNVRLQLQYFEVHHSIHWHPAAGIARS